jgi:hypothetical protein
VNTEDLVAHVLCALAAETNAKSSTGAQLDQLATRSEAKKERHGWGTHSAPTRSGKARDYEGAVMADAETYGVIRGLERIETTTIEIEALRELAEDLGKPLGATCVKVLRTYQSAMRAPSDDELKQAQGRANTGLHLKRIRERQGAGAVSRVFDVSEKVALEAVADAVLVLDAYVRTSRRKKKAS